MMPLKDMPGLIEDLMALDKIVKKKNGGGRA
jgi:3-deoxy-D-manno-octulosonic acid (KDO) 8-phosphate synthase